MKKNVLITGAAGNLGHAAVQKFSRDGYNVLATTLPGEKVNYDLPDNVRIFPVDLGDEKKTDDFITSVINEYKTINAALFLVGGFAMGDVATTDGSALRKMIGLNFETAYFVSRKIFLHMLEQADGGRLVFIGSKPGLQPEAGARFLGYTLSKSLLFAWAKILNAEAGKKNVVSSVIVPSTIDTPSNRAQMPSANFSDWVRPEEIADVMAFICSAEAGALAGSVLKMYNSPQ